VPDGPAGPPVAVGRRLPNQLPECMCSATTQVLGKAGLRAYDGRLVCGSSCEGTVVSRCAQGEDEAGVALTLQVLPHSVVQGEPSGVARPAANVPAVVSARLYLYCLNSNACSIAVHLVPCDMIVPITQEQRCRA
jgi:hypothetical protein